MMKKRPHERPRHRGPSRRHRIRLRWHADAVCAARSRRLSLRRLRWLTRRRRRHARARAGRIDAGDRCAAGLLGRLPRHRGALQPRADRAAGSGHPRHPAVDDLRELSRRHAPGSSQPGPGRGVGDALRPQLPLLRGSVHPAFHAELLYQHRGPDDPRAGRLLRELSRDPGAREVRGGVPVGPAVAGHLIPHSRPTLVEEDAQAVARIVRGGILAQGPEVAGFERALAERLGTEDAAAVASGSVALELALRGLGIDTGDEVLIPSYVCDALHHAITRCGGVPVLVDADPVTLSLSPLDAKCRITPRTRAVIVPHAFGLAADVDAFAPLGVPIVEDCAQALGAVSTGRPVGSRGQAAVCAFYATKLLTTGEGGLVGGPRALVEGVRAARDYDEHV